MFFCSYFFGINNNYYYLYNVQFSNLYIIRVFKKSKGIFVFVILFAIMQYHFFSKREYTFPWFTWDMYSKVEQYPDTVAQTELFVNNQRIDITSIPIWQEETITHTFKMYNWQVMNEAFFTKSLFFRSL